MKLAEVLSRLGTGVYIGNLHYLNWSDRAACRTTGMTRFATFWVEDGEIKAPLNVMRFDETAYRMLGDNLVDLTDFLPTLLEAARVAPPKDFVTGSIAPLNVPISTS